MIKTDSKHVYFQYRPQLGLPIFIQIVDTVLESNLSHLFEELGFEKCPETVLAKEHNPSQLKVLKISMANPMVAKQIGINRDEDKYGHESLTPKAGYYVYRYKGVGLMVFSEDKPLWELGLCNYFHKSDFYFQLRVLFHRFLFYVFAPYNILGVWGATVEEGVVVMSLEHSKGEAVFIDRTNHQLLTIEGVKPLIHPFGVLKLDDSLTHTSKTMKVDELASTLTHHCTYFSYEGLSYQLKREVLYIAQYSEGVRYPTSKFKPRQEQAA